MKQLLRMTFVMACFFLGLITTQAADFKANRTLTKSFSVLKNDILKVNNLFGTISIVEWDKNEISLEVTMVVTAKKQLTADEIIRNINIQLTQETNIVFAETKYPDIRDCKYNVDYKIFAPKNMEYDLKNTYGNITMENIMGNITISTTHGNVSGGEFSGNCTIQTTYGNVKIDKLLGQSNTLECIYAKKHFDFYCKKLVC